MLLWGVTEDTAEARLGPLAGRGEVMGFDEVSGGCRAGWVSALLLEWLPKQRGHPARGRTGEEEEQRGVGGGLGQRPGGVCQPHSGFVGNVDHRLAPELRDRFVLPAPWKVPADCVFF